MRLITGGLIAGLVGGVLTSAGMFGARRAGLPDKTLAEESEDWLDRRFQLRERVGEHGTTAIEQSAHLASAAAFGLTYAGLRPYTKRVPAPIAGAAFGAALYAINIAGLAPLLGITAGERAAPARVNAQRLGFHVLFGAATAMAFEWLSRRGEQEEPVEHEVTEEEFEFPEEDLHPGQTIAISNKPDYLNA